MLPEFAKVAFAARRRRAAFARVGSALDRRLPDGHFWYLVAMKVHPHAQGTGIGSRLVDAGTSRADVDMVPCVLHTSDPANADYYTRFGFRVSEPLSPVSNGGPSYLAMTRPPRVGDP
jgi:predicted N-acetyltransferase YhbS